MYLTSNIWSSFPTSTNKGEVAERATMVFYLKTFSSSLIDDLTFVYCLESNPVMEVSGQCGVCSIKFVPLECNYGCFWLVVYLHYSI